MQAPLSEILMNAFKKKNEAQMIFLKWTDREHFKETNFLC